MDPVVHLTPSCGLKGKLIKPCTTTREDGRDVYRFLGVPFAEPPVGSLRFSDPKPVSLWSGIRTASEFGGVCPQDLSVIDTFPIHVDRPALVSEDCLHVNIWTPSIDSSSRLPVMVWIFGGGFMTGFTDMYDVADLACFHNVVVVTVSYRLGAFGFLCVNDEAATGNYGLLDQIEALKWIQKYISNFGGDPENVTILGQSAGGICVSILVTSPMASGLFKRAIVQSGTVFTCDLGCQDPADSFEKTYAIMEKTMEGCPPSTAPRSEIVEFLRSIPADDLVAKFKDHQHCPVLDRRVIMDVTPRMYERGDFNDCDLIAGCNDSEGEMLYDLFVPKMSAPGEELTVSKAREILTTVIKMLWTLPNGEQSYKAIVDNYVQEGAVYSSEDLRKVTAECMGDVLFVIPSIKAASYHSRKCKTYVYQFCHRPPYAKYPEYAGANHGSELFYTLRMFGFRIDFKEDDWKMARLSATYLTNFARTGNPNGEGLVEWPEYNESTRRHLVLQLQPTSSSKLKGPRADFWLNELPKILNPEQVQSS